MEQIQEQDMELLLEQVMILEPVEMNLEFPGLELQDQDMVGKYQEAVMGKVVHMDKEVVHMDKEAVHMGKEVALMAKVDQAQVQALIDQELGKEANLFNLDKVEIIKEEVEADKVARVEVEADSPLLTGQPIDMGEQEDNDL